MGLTTVLLPKREQRLERVATARYYSKQLDKPLNESTIHAFNEEKSLSIVSLPMAKRGRPLLLRKELDQHVQIYLKKLRECGGSVSSRVVIAAAKGIVLACNKTLLSEFGGPVELGKPWAQSILKRLGWVKRKSTTALSKHNPEDFEKLKSTFLQEVSVLVSMEEIQPDMILNWDQSGIKVLPSTNWTLEKRGSKRIEIVG